MTPAQPALEPSWLIVMREAFMRGRFSEAATIYDSQGAAAEAIPGAMLLRGRITLKTSASAAIDFLLERQDRLTGRNERRLLALYLGIAFTRLREYTVADQRFEEAEALSENDAAEFSEVAYHRGRRFLLEGRISDAWSNHRAMQRDTSHAGSVRSADLKSLIFGFTQQFVEQTAALVELLQIINRDRRANIEEWYCAVHTLAGLARERNDAQAYDVAIEEISRPEEWSPDYRMQQFSALRALGWCKALHGDSLGCFRLLREAQAIAESIEDGKAWRTMVLLDRAHFAMLAGEANWTADELAAAEELARTVSWEHSLGEERVALLLFAELLAERDRERARLFLARFRSLNELRSPMHFFSFADRLAALAESACGTVYLADGDAAAAERSFKVAWSTFDRIGYDWRAGKAALGLFRATGKLRWQLLAAEKLEAYPHSWLYRELQALSAKSSRHNLRLTPMQRRVLDMICDGLSTDEISARLERSPNTVRNHIKLLFKAFDVRSRAALVSRARSVG